MPRCVAKLLSSLAWDGKRKPGEPWNGTIRSNLHAFRLMKPKGKEFRGATSLEAMGSPALGAC
jgi:hypothetical protein